MRLGLLVALVVVLAAAASAATAAPSPSDLEAELVCPTCKTTLDQSDAPIARRMKQIIRTRLSEGATEKEIKAEIARLHAFVLEVAERLYLVAGQLSLLAERKEVRGKDDAK